MRRILFVCVLGALYQYASTQYPQIGVKAVLARFSKEPNASVPANSTSASEQSASKADRTKTRNELPASSAEKIELSGDQVFELAKMPATWPPVRGEKFPNLTLKSSSGKTFNLYDIPNHVFLVEPIGMTCSGCQAFSGGHDKGGFGGVTPQKDLGSIHQYMKNIIGVDFAKNSKVIFIQLLLYDLDMKAPKLADAQNWRRHFDFGKNETHWVVAAGPGMQNPASFNMIPGFFLLGKDHVIYSDSTGHSPKDNLYTHLLPQITMLIAQLPDERTVASTGAAVTIPHARLPLTAQQAPATSNSPATSWRKILSLSPERAYSSIPHRRTVFRKETSSINGDVKNELARLFEIADFATALRVETMSSLGDQQRLYNLIASYQGALSDLGACTVSMLCPYHKMLFEALLEQSLALQDFARTRTFDKNNPHVQKSSARLKEGHAWLNANFPGENSNNKDAFFDYMCALDFI